jgi:heme/copper-type cytochrome/quinol oxidase subunit 1
MIFFLVMPGLFGGYANYLVPIYLGTSEVVYPRINNMSILIVPMAYSSILMSMLLEYNINGIGWTLYPPLSISVMYVCVGLNLIFYSMLLVGVSSSLTSLNFVVTIHIMKAYICTLSNIGCYV